MSDSSPDRGHLQLATVSGWRRFAADMPAVPQLLAGPGGPAWMRTSVPSMTRTGSTTTPGCWWCRHPRCASVITQGRRLTQLNRSAHFGRCGLIVSGPARTGKTTAVTQLGKTIEVIHRRRHPGSHGGIPVIYITVPPAATAKMIAVEFARFLGLPVPGRANITGVIESVCGVCLDARVTLVLVDELHNLNTATRAAPRPPTP